MLFSVGAENTFEPMLNILLAVLLRIKGNLRGQIVQFASQLFRDKDRLLDARQSCERSFYCPCENMQIHAGSLPKCYFDKMQNGVTTPRTRAIN